MKSLQSGAPLTFKSACQLLFSAPSKPAVTQPLSHTYGKSRLTLSDCELSLSPHSSMAEFSNTWGARRRRRKKRSLSSTHRALLERKIEKFPLTLCSASLAQSQSQMRSLPAMMNFATHCAHKCGLTGLHLSPTGSREKSWKLWNSL